MLHFNVIDVVVNLVFFHFSKNMRKKSVMAMNKACLTIMLVGSKESETS